MPPEVERSTSLIAFFKLLGRGVPVLKLNRSEAVILVILIAAEIALSALIYFKFDELGRWKWYAVWGWVFLTGFLIFSHLPSNSIWRRDQTGDRPEK